jgi:hypothetical protein
MPLPHGLKLASLLKSLQRVSARAFQKAEAAVRLPFCDDKRLLHQLTQDLEHLPVAGAGVLRKPLRGLQRETADKHCKAAQDALLSFPQQGVAPLKRRAQCLVPRDAAAPMLCEHVQPLVQPCLQA